MRSLRSASVNERRWFWRGFIEGVILTTILIAWIVALAETYIHSPIFHP